MFSPFRLCGKERKCEAGGHGTLLPKTWKKHENNFPFWGILLHQLHSELLYNTNIGFLIFLS